MTLVDPTMADLSREKRDRHDDDTDAPAPSPNTKDLKLLCGDNHVPIGKAKDADYVTNRTTDDPKAGKSGTMAPPHINPSNQPTDAPRHDDLSTNRDDTSPPKH